MIRYYPDSKILSNQSTNGTEYSVNGKPYIGKYYKTYDGKSFSGANPQTGPNQLLTPINKYSGFPTSNISINQDSDDLATREKLDVRLVNRIKGKPTSFYPQPNSDDYRRGYLIRYFTKKENDTLITEISEEDFNNIVNGTADYDVRIYQTTKILWKITGPLNAQRKSQYNIIPGIIDTNKRLTEAANKTFLGIVDYIGGDYTKYAKPTP